jgi:competence protein CoiA
MKGGIPILTAMTSDDQLFCLTNLYSADDLKQMREAQKFYCPVCRSDLILKVGSLKIPHFAHRASSLCDSFSEPESPQHLQGKLLLYHFFLSNNLSVELEKFLPSIKQRADVFVSDCLAVEYQCSAISASKIKDRTAGYRQLGIETIWIYQRKTGSPSGIQLLKIREFERAVASGPASQMFLLGLDPSGGSFVYYSSLFYLGGNQWIGKVSYLPISKQVFPFAVAKPLKKGEFDLVFSLFAAAREKFINQQLKARNRFANPFWRSCYELSLDMKNLPPIIGVPLPGSEQIPDHPVLWQLKVAEGLHYGHSANSLLDSGQVVLRKESSKERGLVLIERYIEIYIEHKAGLLGNHQLKGKLYDYYCNVL